MARWRARRKEGVEAHVVLRREPHALVAGPLSVSRVIEEVLPQVRVLPLDLG
jgi:hypothetical protein